MDEQAFSTVVQQQEDTLYRIAFTVLHNDADCADALQDALLRAWRRLDTLKDEQAFRSWMARIVINCSRDILRRRRLRTVELDETIAAPPANDQPLAEAIAALPEGLRLPITLHYMEGMSVKEVAQVMRLPQGTVKNRLFRGRARLAAFLQEEEMI
ncbi:MAG TPA: RNA polymerase sigma factor [Candidatus Limiplasma sp.]|nr:RNA polymerase sigma factor [Candidatus Limiplasma sp.]